MQTKIKYPPTPSRRLAHETTKPRRPAIELDSQPASRPLRSRRRNPRNNKCAYFEVLKHPSLEFLKSLWGPKWKCSQLESTKWCLYGQWFVSQGVHQFNFQWEYFFRMHCKYQEFHLRLFSRYWFLPQDFKSENWSPEYRGFSACIFLNFRFLICWFWQTMKSPEIMWLSNLADPKNDISTLKNNRLRSHTHFH